MNTNWIICALAVYGILALAGLAALHMVVTTRTRMRRQQKCHLTESQSLREDIDALKGVVAELESKLLKVCAEARRNVPAPTVQGQLTGLNADKRAEALRMYRRGSNSETVSNALGLKAAEVALLEKVHLLSNGVA